jgi:RsiW-degrading membrane proteinase PrsW (M82 family)
MSFCTHCGDKLSAVTRFCTNCGSPVAAIAKPPVRAPQPRLAPSTRITQAVPAAATQATKASDIRLKIVAGASGLISLGGFVCGLFDLLPSTVCTLIVLIGVTGGLRVLWAFAARSASSAARARTMLMVSNIGLGISVLSILVGLPRITHAAGLSTFLADVIAELWTMAILMVAASHVRTFNWRVLAGASLTGFLGTTALARWVGLPLVENLGVANVFAVAIWVPITEELVKLIPVLIVLAVALRHAHMRPSAMDVTLLGACTGAGFAMYENATLGRGHFSFTAAPLVSLVLPSMGEGRAFGWPMVQTGHLCHTALIALSLALALLYGKRWGQIRWLIPSAAIGVVLLEHMSQNALAIHGIDEWPARIAMLLTLFGWLSPVLLIGSVALLAVFEGRILGGRFRVAKIGRVLPAEAWKRSGLLARAQTGGAA